MSDTLTPKLQGWKAKLLDLSHGNRLLYYKDTKTGTVPITHPGMLDLFERLIIRTKTLKFPLPKEISLFEDEKEDVQEPPYVYSSDEVGSSLDIKQLNRTLYNLRSRSRSALEEQGVNVLFLAFGMLEWREVSYSGIVKSPLLLVPVKLSREALRKPYTITLIEEDIVLNPTLVQKLERDFNIRLPELDEEKLLEAGLLSYFGNIEAAIKSQPGWNVRDNVCLGVFTFHKLSLYKDLEVNLEIFRQNPFIQALGGIHLPSIDFDLPRDIDLDTKVPVDQNFQVLDADSSQQEAIEAAKNGVSFILQGPPGTGKSQTIANIIGECLATNKKILFVSEKMAALEVVYRRLNEAGLSQYCLQIHSHKRDKREVIQELVQTLDADVENINPKYQGLLEELSTIRKQLNAYTQALHQPRFTLGLTAHNAYGELTQLESAPQLRFSPGDIADLTLAELESRRSILEQFTYAANVIDCYADHPWLGSTLKGLIPFELRENLNEAVHTIVDVLPRFIDLLNSTSQRIGISPVSNLQDAEKLLRCLRYYNPKVFTYDLATMRQRFETKYASVLRYVLPSYYQDMKMIRAVYLRHQTKLSVDEATKDIRTLASVQRQFMSLPLSDVPDIDLSKDLAPVTHYSQLISASISKMAEAFNGSFPQIDGEPYQRVSVSKLLMWFTMRLDQIAMLQEWADFAILMDDASAAGISSFIEVALREGIPAYQWPKAYWRGFYQSFVDQISSSDRALATFNSASHNAAIRRFRELDSQLPQIARARIRATLSANRPNSNWIVAASSEQSILRKQAAKKRGLMPLRRLFSQIPQLILDIKPCLLMSPITVSRFLDPRMFNFDVVVFDEASQISPEDAVGAIARGKQVIVVGDSKQLPPTRFFAALSDEEGDEESETDNEVFDSILEESEAAGIPQMMLRWHYRSRHEALIAFSNHNFYGNRLFTFPNVSEASGDLGVRFVYVPDGIYRRGASRRNDVEAQKVVDLVFAHFAERPHLTLGVIAFSQAQQDAIQMALEHRRLEDDSLEAHFSEDRPEPFFVKNLETVQGDERDAIIFSVGYGKDETGKFALNFGPLNRKGGERRLNVAVTRARHQVHLVSSFQPNELDIARSNSIGLRLLRDYMLIARDGMRAMYSSTTILEDADFDSPFEEAVYNVLTQKGYVVRKQVGVSGYRIDLAVVHPDQPGTFILGIECDGASYHSGRTARDRDRLRQQVLANLGWKLHRIWSREWLNNRQSETARLLTAVEGAIVSLEQEEATNTSADEQYVKSPKVSAEELLLKDRVNKQTRNLPNNVANYRLAEISRPYSSFRTDLSEESISVLADLLSRVVVAEGPIHIELAFTRIAKSWQVARLGKNIRARLQAATDAAIRSGGVEKRGHFLYKRPVTKPVIRVGSTKETLRSIEHIAPEELIEAVYLCVTEARSMSPNDLIKQTASLLGYSRVSSQIQSALEDAINALVASKRVEIQDERIRSL